MHACAQEYERALEEPIKVGIQQALVAGVCNGGIHAIVYWTYAVAFIYGAWRVSTGAYTGGDVMNVLVAALVGGFSAGQVCGHVWKRLKCGHVEGRLSKDVAFMLGLRILFTLRRCHGCFWTGALLMLQEKHILCLGRC